jgi:hypothetical protein
MANWPTPGELVSTGVSIILRYFYKKDKMKVTYSHFQQGEFILSKI